MSHQVGNLRNSASDILVDSLLLLAIVCSYIVQISRLQHSASSSGLSTGYLLFHALFSTAQFSHMLMGAAYVWPTTKKPILDDIGDGGIRGWQASGGVLGWLQVAVQCACSIILVIVFTFYSKGPQPRKTIFRLTLLFIASTLLPVMCYTLPKPNKDAGWWDLLLGLITMTNMVVGPLGLVSQFVCQLWRQNGEPRSLSLLWLCLQLPISVALAFRWSLRTPVVGDHTLGEIYAWAMPVINYAVCAVGYSVLLATYYLALKGGSNVGEEGTRTTLLG